MKVIVQNVKSAQVDINNLTVGKIGPGFLLLVGFKNDDSKQIVDKMVDKILKLRVFPDEKGLTNLSILQTKGEILSVSQFTLYGSLVDGNRPSFVEAMNCENAKTMYQYFIDTLINKFGHVENGVFQADMKVSLINDGPFTIILDSFQLWGL
jgi:D-aminoacyl-tRNA deacylase